MPTSPPPATHRRPPPPPPPPRSSSNSYAEQHVHSRRSLSSQTPTSQPRYGSTRASTNSINVTALVPAPSAPTRAPRKRNTFTSSKEHFDQDTEKNLGQDLNQGSNQGAGQDHNYSHSNSKVDDDDDDDDDDSDDSSEYDGVPSEEEEWSVRVRLLSAVDLPPSLSPNVPLCPWFKFGLVEDVGSATALVEQKEEERKRLLKKGEDGQHSEFGALSEEGVDENGAFRTPSKPRRKSLTSTTSESKSNMTSSTQSLDTKASLPAHLLRYLPAQQTRCSASKIMRKAGSNSNGSADWHEEYRWDGLSTPMESVLAVQLSTRLAPSHPDSSIADDASFDGHGSLSSNPSHHPGSNLPNNELSRFEAGIKGLWRKGRQQLEEHRRRATVQANSREERAATVAHFLMKSGDGGLDRLPDLEGRDRRRSAEVDGNMLSPAISGDDVDRKYYNGAHHAEDDDDDNPAEGLCLGTLSIPLSRLPLEDAFAGNGAAVVERWYQLDDPNASMGSTAAAAETALSSYPPPSPGLLHGPRRCPSVLLEITFANADYLDDSEEEIHGEQQNHGQHAIWDLSELNQNQNPMEPSPEEVAKREAAKREAEAAAAAAAEAEKKKKEKKKKKNEKTKPDEPELDPGVVDFACIVGARDIGNQRNDDGSKGWVQSTPECCVLERFPPDDEFHSKNGRNTALIPQVEWFCFPEGCKLWRGPQPPTHDDLKAGGVSSPTTRPSLDSTSSITLFDACLGSSSSFSWFVLSSNSDDYGSKLVKTYGVVVRFYVPAPKGIDPTQDDFAQTITQGGAGFGAVQKGNATTLGQKRLWVPIGICLTSTLPIVGVVEEILLRMCDAFSSKLNSDRHGAPKIKSDASGSTTPSKLYDMLQKDLFHLVCNFSMPIPGVVHCSIPFLQGERLHVATPPPNGLPPLPHGGAVVSACRLLGAEGLTLLLAAALTECKILIHSVNVANVAMIAEVITALIFPFTWQLPYIPVLPKDMLEFLEAPLSFFVGVPTANMQFVDKNILSEIVVVDLDDVSSSTDYEGSRRGPRTKIPSALPASVSTSISKAVFRLLREEEELEAQMNAALFPGCRRSPHLETESLSERKFRIYVALQICSLVRGYQECLFFVSASQPVFNRDRFLRQAPALFEEKRSSFPIDSTGHFSDRGGSSQKILSPRSKRFLSVLVNSQHFHQLLERLSSEETAFFHEVMESIEPEEDIGSGSKNYFSTVFGSAACEDAAQKLLEALEQIEQKIPTYRVDREPRTGRPRGAIASWDDDDDDDEKWDSDPSFSDVFGLDRVDKTPSIPFTYSILQPIMTDSQNDSAPSSGEAGVHALSLQYLVELEKNPWRYRNILEMPVSNDPEETENKPSNFQTKQIQIRPRTKLREAIGERRFRAWKIANDHKDDDDVAPTTPVVDSEGVDKSLDLSSILSTVPELPLEGGHSAGGYETQPNVDANDRTKVRHCLERAFGSGQDSTNFQENGRDLISDAEAALRNPSAQRYLFSVLSQRTRIENQRRKRHTSEDSKHKSSQQSVSRLEPNAFECIVRLCYAVLEACMEEQNYESAYRLLTYTGGFCTAIGTNAQADREQKTIYMTARIKIHPIFADLRLWERVLLLHQQDQQNDRNEAANSSSESASADLADSDDATDNDGYDAAVSTLYEMVGYGVPAEELSRFATRISEEKGWFATEKGQALLVLARRLTVKRDEDDEESEEAGDLVLGNTGVGRGKGNSMRDRANSARTDISLRDLVGGGVGLDSESPLDSIEIAWAHPSTSLHSEKHGFMASGAKGFLGNMLGTGVESRLAGSGNPYVVNNAQDILSSDGSNRILDAKGYSGRVAITAMASFGSTAVATGGIDGSVFLAHTINFGAENSEFDSSCSAAGSSSCSSPLHSNKSLISGVKLQWGASGDADRDLGSGAISCLAASKGAGFRLGGTDKSSSKSGSDGCVDEDEIISSMEGCRVIAGTTSGGLRVWSLKDVYAASCMSRRSSGPDIASSNLLNRSHHGSGSAGMSSSLTRSGADDFGMQDAIKGYSIGGHRGGVTCIDVPPRMYRPDTLLSGGEDGLIKLWSLRSPSSLNADGVSHNPQNNSIQSRFFANNPQMSSKPNDSESSDAQGVLTGHEGKILCIKTAWHGDKLLSGGADKTVRLWDLSGSAGKPLMTLSGHLGWVTESHFWGPHIIVSASTDRSIALWDSRAGSSPLFALRYHLSPVSDLLLGSRSEPLMVSAASDGSLATWDFRVLSGPRTESTPDGKGTANTAPSSRTIREPVAKMNHLDDSKGSLNCGSVKLSRAVGRHEFSFLSVCDDGIINEWDATAGSKMSTHDSGHRDSVSAFATFSSSDGLRHNKQSSRGGASSVGGTITCSWDGTVRLRRLSRKPAR